MAEQATRVGGTTTAVGGSPGVGATLARYRRVLGYALAYWPTLVQVLALSVVVSVVAALQPWPLKILVDYGFGSERVPAALSAILPGQAAEVDRLAIVAFAAGATLLVFAASALFEAWLTLSWSKAGQRMVNALASDLFMQLQRLSLLFHARRSVGDWLSRITGDAWTAYTLVDNLLVSPVKHLVAIATVGVLAWQLDPALALLLLLAMPLLGASALWFGNRLKDVERGRREASAALTAFVHQTLGAMPAVQAFGAARPNRRMFAQLAQTVVCANRSATLIRDSYGILNGVATTIGIALVVYVGGSRVLSDELSLGTLLVFVAYARSLEAGSRGLLRAYGELRGAEAGVERVLEVLEADERVEEAERPRSLPPRRAAATGHVVFDRVTFGYDRSRPVLRSLGLELRPGETLALVGETGAGKTTLASLLPRFFDPWTGRVLLDGVDVRSLRLAALRGELGLVLQDPFILPLTVAENIAYGRAGASFAEVVAAAVAANADEFIRLLPQGYETVIGEQGGDLSGGQRQRIAIARALLKNPRVLILDEPTAALDAGSEAAVMEALGRLTRGRSTLIIAHRLSTIRRADRVAVLHDGCVDELGTHAELVRRGGRYARFQALSESGNAPGASA